MSNRTSKRVSEFEDVHIVTDDIPYETLYRVKLFFESEIDQFMREIGYGDPERYTDENGWRTIRKGSAIGMVGITIEEKSVVLHAHAFVMQLPSDRDLVVPLMRELLEINATIPNESRFGINGSYVIAGITKSITKFEEDLVPYAIHNVMSLADDFDDYLIAKYGGTSKSRG